jgi:hypothetical protein
MSWKPIKVISSHAGKSRWLGEAEDTDYVIARIPEIPSPYAYSPVWNVYKWRDKFVFLRETRHKRYEVFAVPSGMPLLSKEEN